MMNRENRPFKGKEGWRKRAPLCPDCDRELRHNWRKYVRVLWFDRAGDEQCLDPACSESDHDQEVRVKVYRCTNKACNNSGRYAAHPLEARISITCKCDGDVPFSFGEMLFHMSQVHSVDKHSFIQMCYDHQRPETLPVEPGQKQIRIELPDLDDVE